MFIRSTLTVLLAFFYKKTNLIINISTRVGMLDSTFIWIIYVYNCTIIYDYVLLFLLFLFFKKYINNYFLIIGNFTTEIVIFNKLQKEIKFYFKEKDK